MRAFIKNTWISVSVPFFQPIYLISRLIYDDGILIMIQWRQIEVAWRGWEPATTTDWIANLFHWVGDCNRPSICPHFHSHNKLQIRSSEWID